MNVNATHPDYDAALPIWLRARDVMAGEDAVKSGGEKYLPRLEAQTDEEYAAYLARGTFFNAAGRTADGFVGLLFRREPTVRVPDPTTGLGSALSGFLNDADMAGMTFASYARAVVREVLVVGRAGSLVDWDGEGEHRAFVTLCKAEDILNWRVERVGGRNVLTLLVLHEWVRVAGGDVYETKLGEQVRVLRLGVDGCQVEVWRPGPDDGRRRDWVMVESRTPLRLGRPLALIPFVFHGTSHCLPDVDRLPLGDVITVNLDHFRLNADYRHGMHFTALPTAWVCGFDKSSTLRIGSSTAWVTETPGATAGFLEFRGDGLETFERAMDRDERLMAILGARMLESEKRTAETQAAIELRMTGEHSVLGALAGAVSVGLTNVLRWVYWWNSTEARPEDLTGGAVTFVLNVDYSVRGLTSADMNAVVQAWQNGALSQDTMLDIFRRGEVIAPGRTNEQEARLIALAGGGGNLGAARQRPAGDPQLP